MSSLSKVVVAFLVIVILLIVCLGLAMIVPGAVREFTPPKPSPTPTRPATLVPSPSVQIED